VPRPRSDAIDSDPPRAAKLSARPAVHLGRDPAALRPELRSAARAARSRSAASVRERRVWYQPSGSCATAGAMSSATGTGRNVRQMRPLAASMLPAGW
jgi:hypothetical protein